ncbi:hypothetical protein AARAC_001161 [Aspergillus arachidicola]|uniref:Ecp2 effector protein domain-containing protein n=1 Tax=Aspergillus arachidicola TaxID=656916 RepID=A0A2G7FRS4_9EURO|nr:hypothetical protein AARAC_001161 [Aspergillus arachidicola]
MKFFAITLASLASISGALASASGSNDACSKFIYSTLYNKGSTDVYHWREVIDKSDSNPCASTSDACGRDLYKIFKEDQNQDVYNWKQDMIPLSACKATNDACGKFLWDTFHDEKSTDMANWKQIIDAKGSNPCNDLPILVNFVGYSRFIPAELSAR